MPTHLLSQCVEWAHPPSCLHCASAHMLTGRVSGVISITWHTGDLAVLSLNELLQLPPQQLLTSEGCSDTTEADVANWGN